MPMAPVNGIEICHEMYGSSDDPVLILINGFGSQLIRWPQSLIDAITGAGYRLIIFDNRDVGLSTKCGDLPAYTIEDMADDAAGLLDHLGIERAHVVGMSMGGMIAQFLAIGHPQRVLSLASIMSTTGGDKTVPGKPEAIAALMGPPVNTREEFIANDVRTKRIITGSGFPFDEDAARELSGRVYDRCYAPDGRMRQMLAIRNAPSRVDALASLDVPTVVIHGEDDPLVPVSNGRQTAEIVPGAELVTIPGMGHDLPAGVIAPIVDAIVTNARRAAGHPLRRT